MKLASLKSPKRDGQLVVVSRDMMMAKAVPDIVQTMQELLDHWDQLFPFLQEVYDRLNNDKEDDASVFSPAECAAPLPRAYQWLDGSAYLNHVILVRRARGAEMPHSFLTDPLMYQGVSDHLLGPHDPAYFDTEDWGIDFEAEVVVITDNVPMGLAPSDAEAHIKLLTLVNDISLRNLIPQELGKGFGFLQSKPPSAYAPVAITPDELGSSWKDCKVHLPLSVHYNDKLFGSPNCGQDMNFNFAELLAHAAKTRSLGAGTMLGSGTISNKDESTGSCCLAEKRMLEIINNGQAETPFMKFGDHIRIEMLAANGTSVFGAIDQVMRQRKK